MNAFNETGIIRVRNVNGALQRLRSMMREPNRDKHWRDISPRGNSTMEHRGPMITEYQEPMERVLWSPHRDANPFFHVMEALWILAGRKDTKFLIEFNSRMVDYSDNRRTFHAPYGYRLRHWPGEHNCSEYMFTASGDDDFDQLTTAIELLKADHNTRQVVLSIWNPEIDLGAKTKDMPCNDMIMFKIREGALHMTVACRSNDAIWGAYGANVVQFSTLQEFVASAVGVSVGIYRQISDSFHVYTDQDAWLKVVNSPSYTLDPYLDMAVDPFPLFQDFKGSYREWLAQCEAFCEEKDTDISYFNQVAEPMRAAWRIYKGHGQLGTLSKEQQAHAAIECLERGMAECDWKLAAIRWLMRHGGLDK